MKIAKCMFLMCTVALLAKGWSNEYPYREVGPLRAYGSKRLELVAKFIPKNPVIFEAGGHYGTDTVRFAKQWPGAKIISFEANPHAFEEFQKTTRGYDQIHGHNMAVNNYNGTATLHVCHGSTGDNPVFEGASSLLEPSKNMEVHYQGPKVTVPCVVLDDWCRNNEIDHFDFMWLDLEGLELTILRSSPELLKKVKVIYTETNFQAFRKKMTQFHMLKTYLENSGFELAAHWYAQGFQGDAVFIKKSLMKKWRAGL